MVEVQERAVKLTGLRARLIRQLITLQEEEKTLVVRNREVQSALSKVSLDIEQTDDDLFEAGEELVERGYA